MDVRGPGGRRSTGPGEDAAAGVASVAGVEESRHVTLRTVQLGRAARSLQCTACFYTLPAKTLPPCSLPALRRVAVLSLSLSLSPHTGGLLLTPYRRFNPSAPLANVMRLAAPVETLEVMPSPWSVWEKRVDQAAGSLFRVKDP